MGRVRMTVEISGPEVDGADPLGMKEAVTVDLEKYGRVTVSRVEVDRPEQQCVEALSAREQGGFSQSRSEGKKPAVADGAKRDSEGMAARRGGRIPLICCDCCGQFRYAPGPDGQGRIHWGTCRRTGRTVDKLSDRCGEWRPRE